MGAAVKNPDKKTLGFVFTDEREGGCVKMINTLFAYQKFQPNAALQGKIDAVGAKYLPECHEIPDDELDISAAGEAVYRKSFRGDADADRK